MVAIPAEHNPIAPEDLPVLIAWVSRIDGHDRDRGDLSLWAAAARADRWTRAQVIAACFGLATWRGFRLQPGDVSDRIRADATAIRQRWYCPDPPRHLADDVRAELAWRRQAAADYRGRALMALVAGDDIDDVPLVLDPEPKAGPARINTLSQLVAAAPPQHRPALAAAARRIQVREGEAS